MAEIKITQSAKDAYNSIRSGAGLQNNLTATIAPLKGRVTSLKIIAQGYIPDPNLLALITNLEDLEDKLDEFQIHTDSLSGAAAPPEGAAPYDFVTRVSILETSANIVESGFDLTDPETVEDKRNKIFGSLLTNGTVILGDLDTHVTALEDESGSQAELSLEAAIQNPNLVNDIAALDNAIVSENGSLEAEIQRIKDLGLATRLASLSTNPEFSTLLDNVASDSLKDDLGL